MTETLEIQGKPKNKYYTEKHKEYMRKYREKKTEAYVTCQRQAARKHQANIRRQAKQFQKLEQLGLVPVSVN